MRADDAEKLAVLWTAAQGEVAAFLRSVLQPGEVSDVLQQVAVKLVRNWDSYDQQRAFTPWAIGVAKHEALAWRRKQATDRHRFSDDVVQRVAQAFAESSEEGRDREAALQACLERIDERGRRALDIHYGQGLPTDKVAQALGISGGAARMLRNLRRR